MKGEMPDFAPKFISHDTNGRNDIHKKILSNTVTNFFYILQIRVNEIPRNKCNFNKQFQAQLKTRYPHIFVIYTLILLYLREGLIACRLHKCRFCTRQFSETTSKFVVIDIFVAADLKRYFAVHSQVYDCSQMYYTSPNYKDRLCNFAKSKVKHKVHTIGMLLLSTVNFLNKTCPQFLTA